MTPATAPATTVPPAELDELKPCAHCSGTAAAQASAIGNWVVCVACGVGTGNCQTLDASIRTWNRRA